MPVYINGKRAASLFFNGKRIAQAWKNGVKVFQKSAPDAPDGLSLGVRGADYYLRAWRRPQADGYCYLYAAAASSTMRVWRAPATGPRRFVYVKWAEIGGSYVDSIVFDHINNLLLHDNRYTAARTVTFYDGDGTVAGTVSFANAAVVNATNVTYTALDLCTKGTRSVTVPKEATFTPAHAASDGHRVSPGGATSLAPVVPFLYTDSAVTSGALGYKKLVYCHVPYTPSGEVAYGVAGFMPLVPITYGYAGRYLEAGGDFLTFWSSKGWPSGGGLNSKAAFVPVWTLDGSSVTIDQTNGVGDQLMSTWDNGGPWAWTTSENARTRLRIHTSAASRAYGPNGSGAVSLNSYSRLRAATLVAGDLATEVVWYDSSTGWLKKVSDSGTLDNLWNLGARVSIPGTAGLAVAAISPGVFAVADSTAAGTGFIASFTNDWASLQILYSNWALS